MATRLNKHYYNYYYYSTTLNGPRVHGISPVGEEKVYGGKDLPESQVFSSEWKTERLGEDDNGDSEDKVALHYMQDGEILDILNWKARKLRSYRGALP